MPGREDRDVFARMALGRGDVANAAMPVIVVVPMHELARPLARGVQIREASSPYFAVRNRLSTKALSSLTRGREYEGFTPSHHSMASTVVAFRVAPLSPCSTGRSSRGMA